MNEKIRSADDFKFKDPSELEKTGLPDAFRFFDGSAVGVGEWPERAEELRAAYQHYMYGRWRDGSDERLSYELSENGGAYALKIKIQRISTGAEASFGATVTVPDKSVAAPNGGYPVIVGMHAGISENVAKARGYAVITLDSFAKDVAADNDKHVGAFYDLYPYGDDPGEQTGVLMAWSWGCSKIVDALEAGLGGDLDLSAVNTVVTGVSRWGKAALVCGAFDRRFRMVAPSCSGAGGVALFRYKSEGKTYDFGSKGADRAYKYGKNEPLESLQSPAERGWFNDAFLRFQSAEALPFDQHLLCGLVAEKDRLLFIIGSCINEDWVNAPAMWYSYLGAKKIFESSGLGGNIAINIHAQGHAVIPEDVEYMTEFFNCRVYGKAPAKSLDALKTSVFALEENRDEEMEKIIERQ